MGTMECWDVLAEDRLVIGVVGWVLGEQLAWLGLEEKIRLTNDQEEERALLVLNEGEDSERWEDLRFFDGRWWSLEVVKMKQPR